MQNSTHKLLQHKFLLMLLCLFLGFTVSAQDVLMTQSFENGGAMPAGWAKTTVAGNDALSFVTTSLNPGGFAPTDGAYMVRFNSYNNSTAENRLYMTSYFSTIAKEDITVAFSWLQSISYATDLDRVTVQWSPDGTTWYNSGTYNRPGATDGWITISDVLPAAAQNQPSLHLGLLFTSEWGNDCYLDNVSVTGVNLAEPVSVIIGTGTTTVGHPFYTLYEDAKTQMLFTAAEIIAGGGAMGDITTLAFDVASANSEPLNGLSIDIQHTSAATLTGFISSGWTNVFSGTHVCSNGWNVFTFDTPFDWDGISNIVINVCYDNDDWGGNSTVRYTSSTGRTWHQHDDDEVGCAFAGGSVSDSRPNIQMTIEITPPLPTSIVQGYITNAYGIPIPDATVVATNDFGTFTTTSGPNGAYIMNDTYIGEYTMYAVKEGYNLITVNNVLLYEGQTTNLNIALTQPSMAITPNPYTVTLNPNEYLTGAFNIMNNGNGPLGWAAAIEFMDNDKSHYPIYTSVAVNEVVNSADRAPAGSVPYDPTGELNNPTKDPTDIGYGYVASPLGGLTEAPCSFMLNNPGLVTNFGNAAADFIAAADFVGDIWYGAIYGGSQLLTIDPITGAYTNIGATGDFVGMSWNQDNETMYALSYEGTLYTVNLETGAATSVGPTGTTGFIAFEIDNDGIGYAVNLDTDQLGTINLETGAWTSIGPVGFNASYAQDMSCDHSTNELYWAAYDAGTSQGKLLLVNKTNGSSQLIGTFPGGSEIDGFAIPGSGGGGWLTLGAEAGTVNAFSNYSLPAYFSAEDTEVGEVYTAEVTFTSDPNVGTVVIPVTMMIAGPALSSPTNLTAVLTDPFIGQVNLSWSFQPTGDFINFVIKRDNVVVGYSNTTSFVNLLPGYGLYEYTVQAVFEQGESLPAGPVEVEWPNPTIMVDPTYVYDEVWVNNQVIETVTINNTGEGTLAFSFPAWVSDEGDKEPLAYCTASGGCDERISSVVFNTINNATGCSNYADYTAMSTELQMGQTYSIAITNSSPYSSDVAGVWIDWNHNESFLDAGEFFPTVSSGGASFAADITVPNTSMKGATRMRVRVQYGGTLAPCDATSFGEVEDYTVRVVKTTGFIVDVHPAEGIVPQGGSKTVNITWDATDFDPNQSYFENLVVESNDVANPSVTIVNEMYVYTPSQFEGTVTDINTGEPLNGVVVTAAPAGEFADYIVDDGTYENGYGYSTVGDMGSIGNLYTTTDEGYLVSVDAYLYSGGAMTVPLNIEIYDADHNLLGVSDPIVINNVGWYTFNLPYIQYSGNFYCMLHWPTFSGSTRYLGFDENGPNAASGKTFELYDGDWFSFLTDYDIVGILQLRPKAFVTGETNPVTYAPTANGTNVTTSHLAYTNISGDSGRSGAVETNTGNTRDVLGFQTITNDQGEYTLVVDPGVYNVSFEKPAYQTLVIADTAAIVGTVVQLDAQLREESYPPSFVYAEVNEDDTQVVVTWGDGSGPYDVIYDDGSAENMTAWAVPGNMNAVKFAPANYPATVLGARIYVGDGTFPNNNTGFIGVTFGAMVKDDDGPNGLPGTTLDSIQVVVTNYGWLSFTGFDAEITDGNFYIVMVQGSVSPNTAPIGIDEDMPIVYRSYSRNVGAGMPWALSPYQDFMMRAIVYGSPGTSTLLAHDATEVRIPAKQRGLISMSAPKSTAGGAEGTGIYKVALDGIDNTRAVTGYRVVRFSGFNPENNPTTGTATNIANNVSGNTYTDNAWAGLPAGWYAYGVAAHYPDNFISDTTVSNIVGHLIDAEVTINVTLTTGQSPAGAYVSLTGNQYPFDVFTATVPEDGQVVFSPVYFGPYTLFVSKVGFDDYTFDVNISGDRTIDVMLAEKKYKPRNLYVDPLTLVATWDEPLSFSVMEDFEGAVFPPEGWQKITQNTTGWYATTDGSSSSWVIPAHTKYAVVNDDADNGNGCCDYLITPEMNWTDLDSYRLVFASFYDAAFGQSAYVEMSTDAGETWTVINTLSPATAWTQVEIDLAQYSGASGLSSVWLAFHSDDNGEWASGWAIDDVMIMSGGVPLQGYGVFLDGTLVGNTIEETFTYTNLNYGQEYLAGVAALFSSGYSELDTYLFRSQYLIPPDSLEGMSPELTNYVYLTWNEPVSSGGGTGGTLIEDFEAGTLPEGWLSIDEDGDGYIWDNSAIEFAVFDAHTGAYCMASASYRNDVGALNPNNWLITPPIQIGSQSELRFWVDAQDPAYAAEQYYVKVSTTGTDIEDFTETIHTAVSTGTWAEVVLDLGEFAGNEVYIAFVHADVTDMFFLKIDDVSIANATGMWPATTPVEPGISQALPFRTSGMSTSEISANLAQYNEQVVKAPVRAVPGIMGYNVYRGEEAVGYVDHPTTEYYDLNLDPGTYTYYVTAVYDLTPYGFPFQTAESMKEGPVDVDVIYGYELPFVEDFSTGVFTTNSWTTDGTNWQIAGQEGNPLPSVEFVYTPQQIDYALSLSSSWLIGAGFIDGKIYLDFDLRLDDNTATGDEELLVEVYNGNAWVNITSFTAEGDEDWATKHIDISDAAKGNVFRVRFTAKGLNSLDINKWQIDNINIYRICEGPTNLVATLPDPENHGDQILLTWDGPSVPVPVAEWIMYDDGVNASGIGVGVEATWAAAIRFTPTQLAEYVGTSLTKIRFVPATQSAGCTFVLKVWTGANASTLVATQPVASFTAATWNEYTLNTPVYVSGTTELWIGYEVTQTATAYPGGTDDGPAIDGYGDMANLDGVWETLVSLNPQLNFNWNIQGFVETLSDANQNLQPIADNSEYNANGAILAKSNVINDSPNAVAPVTAPNRQFTGYNIYRDEVLIATTTETEYLDTDPAISILNQEYCYQVSAVYADCEPFSNVDCETVIDIDEIDVNSVNIYPNPSNSIVNIELSNDIAQLVIYNGVGQVVSEIAIAKDKTIQIDVRHYTAGAYLVKFITNSGESFTKRIAVTK